MSSRTTSTAPAPRPSAARPRHASATRGARGESSSRTTPIGRSTQVRAEPRRRGKGRRSGADVDDVRLRWRDRRCRGRHARHRRRCRRRRRGRRAARADPHGCARSARCPVVSRGLHHQRSAHRCPWASERCGLAPPMSRASRRQQVADDLHCPSLAPPRMPTKRPRGDSRSARDARARRLSSPAAGRHVATTPTVGVARCAAPRLVDEGPSRRRRANAGSLASRRRGTAGPRAHHAAGAGPAPGPRSPARRGVGSEGHRGREAPTGAHRSAAGKERDSQRPWGGRDATPRRGSPRARGPAAGSGGRRGCAYRRR